MNEFELADAYGDERNRHAAIAAFDASVRRRRPTDASPITSPADVALQPPAPNAFEEADSAILARDVEDLWAEKDRYTDAGPGPIPRGPGGQYGVAMYHRGPRPNRPPSYQSAQESQLMDALIQRLGGGR